MKRNSRKGRLGWAVGLRNNALAILAERGVVECGSCGPALRYKQAGLELSHSAPFTSELAGRRVFPASLFAAPSRFRLQHSLNIWDSCKKVMNIEWEAEDSLVELVSARRGEWEIALLREASRYSESKVASVEPPRFENVYAYPIHAKPGRASD